MSSPVINRGIEHTPELCYNGNMKHCNKCKKDKPFSEFYKDSRTLDGHNHKCKDCLLAYNRKYQSSPERKEQKKRIRMIYLSNPINSERDKLISRERNKRNKEFLWKVILNHYGSKCNCPHCSETNPLFLTIDHVNNDGYKDRRSGATFYRWIIKNNFPSDLQIFCFNCNLGKQRNKGTCPHVL